MKLYCISIYIGIFLATSSFNLNGQECRNYQYASAALELETSIEIKKEIKRVFKKEFRKKRKKIEFNISNQIDYLSLYGTFDKQLDSIFFQKNDLSQDEESKEKYDDQQRFESYKSECLHQLIHFRNTFLELRSSKPKENYLIAELLDKRINQGQVKFGKAIQFLFLFDEKGIITKVYNNARMYN